MTDPQILTLDPTGDLIADDRAAALVIGDALSLGVHTVVIPTARLDPVFFDLRTGIAGQIVNKFAVYRIRLAILGDVSPYESASPAFRDFVREANRGDHLWFIPTQAALDDRLNQTAQPLPSIST